MAKAFKILAWKRFRINNLIIDKNSKVDVDFIRLRRFGSGDDLVDDSILIKGAFRGSTTLELSSVGVGSLVALLAVLSLILVGLVVEDSAFLAALANGFLTLFPATEATVSSISRSFLRGIVETINSFNFAHLGGLWTLVTRLLSDFCQESWNLGVARSQSTCGR